MKFKKSNDFNVPKGKTGAFITNTVVNGGNKHTNTPDIDPEGTIEDAKRWVDENHL